MSASEPTFFELAAADGLSQSLKQALSYSLSVFAQRRLGLHRVLAREDEAFAALTLLAECQSLAACDASLAESLYGLRRVSAAGEALSRRQQLLSLAALVALPYLRARAERAFLARTGGHAQRLGLLSAEEQADDQSTPEQQHAGASRLERLFLAAFPWAHWALEMSQFVSGLSYVLGASRVHSPLLALLRLRMARSGPAELGAFAARVSLGRAAALEAARSARLGSLRALALRACYRCVDAARPTLFAAVLAFKLSEWWFNSAEAVLRQQPRLPVPPPPPRLPLAPGGLPLPDDPRLCPACLRTRTNPALAAPSGIAFCYPCLRLALDRAGRCPVTGVSVAADQVRRLYEGTSGS